MSQPSSYTDSQVVSDLRAAAAASGNDHKAIVTMFFYGGMDTNNVLVPTGSNPNLATYESMRATGVRIEQSEISKTLNNNGNLSTPADGSWGLNPTLSFFGDLWDDGDLVFIHDVGIVNEPTSKEDYLANTVELQPVNLFAHDKQQELWQTAEVHKTNSGTGWLGRTANLMDPFFDDQSEDPIYNPERIVDSGSFSLIGTDVQTVSYPNMFSVNYPPIVFREAEARKESNASDADVQSTSEKLRHENSDPDPLTPQTNKIIQSFIDIYNDSIDSQSDASNNIYTWNDDDSVTSEQKNEIEAIFTTNVAEMETAAEALDIYNPSSTWIYISRSIAEILYSSKSEGYNQRRQSIFAGYGGWDNHTDLRTAEDKLLLQVNYAVKALVEFLKHPSVDMYDDVAIMHQSDFNRTMSSNNTAGTDHAWAGHSFVIGGPVKGGFYPTNYSPIYDPTGIKSDGDGNNLGRYIPEVSVEMVYTEVLEWFGIPRKHVSLILPALPRFTTNSSNTQYIFPNKPAGVNYSIDFI